MNQQLGGCGDSGCRRDESETNPNPKSQFCVRDVLVHLPPDSKKSLPKDLQEGVLEAPSIQALGQGTGIQVGLAVKSQNATLSVKKWLACEQFSYFRQAHCCLQFIKWKYLEAKAAAYHHHGLILDKGTEPSCHFLSYATAEKTMVHWAYLLGLLS